MGYPGAVEYKRQYTLWLLIVLVIICWPIAIIYYFTRPKVPVQTLTPGYMPQQPVYSTPAPQPAYSAPPAQAAAPPAAGAPTAAPVICPTCGKPATWIAQYSRYYCYTDQKYV